MSVLTGVLAAGRRQAELRMLDSCTIVAESPATVDPLTLVTTNDGDIQYAGKCRLSGTSGTVSDMDSAGVAAASQALVLSIPVADASGVRRNAVVTITASLTDPSLVGRRYRIAGMSSGSQTTAARFPVEWTS